MRKLILIAALVSLVVVLTLGSAFAGMEMEDPILCVAGQWLVVDAVQGEQDVTVILPAGTSTSECGEPYADEITNVAFRQGNSSVMRVEVNGAHATTPTVSASYDGATFTKPNNGKRVLVFQFNLH